MPGWFQHMKQSMIRMGGQEESCHNALLVQAQVLMWIYCVEEISGKGFLGVKTDFGASFISILTEG